MPRRSTSIRRKVYIVLQANGEGDWELTARGASSRRTATTLLESLTAAAVWDALDDEQLAALTGRGRWSRWKFLRWAESEPGQRTIEAYVAATWPTGLFTLSNPVEIVDDDEPVGLPQETMRPSSRAEVLRELARLGHSLQPLEMGRLQIIAENLDASGYLSVAEAHQLLFPKARSVGTANKSLSRLRATLADASREEGSRLELSVSAERSVGAAHRRLCSSVLALAGESGGQGCFE